MGGMRVLTVILDTYYRPALLKEAVEALFRQTYGALEIILVNNGGTPETVEYLHEASKRDQRVKLIHFHENQYSPDDPQKMLDVCLNAGLRAATGDYIWYQADDDLIADDYAEKMVALLEGHPECTTAAGLPVAIDIHGQPMDRGPRLSNFRPRYMPGHVLALDASRGGRTMFSAPGTIFTIRREVLLKVGGFHRATELSHLYGIVPFGVTGFDETAIFYWRRHEGQMNRQLSARGWIGLRESLDLLDEWEIERRWRVFGTDLAHQVVGRAKHTLYGAAAKWFAFHICRFRLRASLRILRCAWSSIWFWWEVPGNLLKQTQRELLALVKRPLKPLIQQAVEHWPRLAEAFPSVLRRRERMPSRKVHT